MKQCFKCKKKKALSEFYKHSGMADGHLNKCKECNKKDTIENRLKNVEYYNAYDRCRNKQPHRVAATKIYQASEHGKEILSHARRAWAKRNNEVNLATKKRWVEKNREKRRAHSAVNNAIRKGEIMRKACVTCGNEKSHAHHHDYSKPLEVEWLCAQCHKNEHKKLNDN